MVEEGGRIFEMVGGRVDGGGIEMVGGRVDGGGSVGGGRGLSYDETFFDSRTYFDDDEEYTFFECPIDFETVHGHTDVDDGRRLDGDDGRRSDGDDWGRSGGDDGGRSDGRRSIGDGGGRSDGDDGVRLDVDDGERSDGDDRGIPMIRAFDIDDDLRRSIIGKCMCLLASGGVTVGYLVGLSGGIDSIPQFLFRLSPRLYKAQAKSLQDNYCVYTNHMLILHTGIIILMAGVGGFYPACLRSRGWRPFLIATGLVQLAGISCMAWFPCVAVEVIGRVASGLTAGAYFLAIPIYCAHILPADLRPHGNVVFYTCTAIGSFCPSALNLMASYFHIWGWHVSIALAAVPSIATIVLILCLVESPRFLVERGLFTDADLLLRRIRGSSFMVTEVFEIHDAVGRSRRVQPFFQLLRARNRPPLLIVTVTTISARLLGIEMLGFFGPYFLQSLGYEVHEAFVATLIVTSIQTLSQTVGVYAIRRFGRSTMYSLAFISLVISLVSLGIIFHMNPNPSHHLSHPMAFVAGSMVVLYNLALGFLPGPLGWLYSSFPGECGDQVTAMANGLSFFVTFGMSHAILHMVCLAHEYMFMGCVISTVIFWGFALAFIPETADVPQAELADRVWRQHWFWRRYFRTEEADEA